MIRIKPVPDYPNYGVTESGQIINIKTGRVLSMVKNKFGYMTVALCEDGVMTRHKVHRLVALAYVPNPENKPQVNHKDEVKDHNHYTNLEWMTNQENKEYSSSKHYTFISPDEETIEAFNISKFSRDNNLHATAMCRVAQGKQRQHKGWKRYE